MKELVCFKWVLPAFLKLFLLGGFFLSPFVAPLAYAQVTQKTITGRVLDADNQPLAGATVSIKGRSGSGTTTDENGAFTIVANTGDVLEFSAVGRERREARVGESNIINITLATNATSMNEVVVP